jgi:SPOR domain
MLGFRRLQFVTDRPQKVEVGYMKVTCPKCQFENQADSSRVVCARCATIIEVRMDQGFDSNGKRQTARLPFATGSSSTGGQSLSGQRFNQGDVFATRIGDDFDDVLDVPVQPQPGYQTMDEAPPVPVFEDVFTAPQSQDQTSPYDFPAYDKSSAAPIDAYGNPGARQREPQDYIEPTGQEFVGWPVLPEGAEEEEETAGSGRGGFFLRLGLIVGLLGVVGFWAYYFFLGDFIARYMGKEGRAVITESAPNTDPSGQAASQAPDPQVSPETQVATALPGGEAVSQDPANSQNTRAKDRQPPVDVPPVTRSEPRVEPAEILPPQTPVRSRSKLTIQVGSFKDQTEADQKASSLNAAIRGEFQVVRAEIPGMGVWYRVQQVSGFASREAALSYGNQLRARNLISDFIVTTR